MSTCTACEVIKKRRQIAMLENIVAIDRILFPESTPNKKLEEADLQHYRKLKNAMLVNLYEMYKTLNYVSETTYKGGISQINDFSYKRGGEVFRETASFIKTPEVLKSINESIQSLIEKENISFELASNKITLKQFMEIALDKLMLENAFNSDDYNAKDLKESKSWEYLLAAHKSFRNDLIKIALKEITDKKMEEYLTNSAKVVGKGALVAGAVGAGMMLNNKIQQKQRWRIEGCKNIADSKEKIACEKYLNKRR